jgi:hypothetical protein
MCFCFRKWRSSLFVVCGGNSIDMWSLSKYWSSFWDVKGWDKQTDGFEHWNSQRRLRRWKNTTSLSLHVLSSNIGRIRNWDVRTDSPDNGPHLFQGDARSTFRKASDILHGSLTIPPSHVAKYFIYDSQFHIVTPYLVEALCYKQEGRGFHSRWDH